MKNPIKYIFFVSIPIFIVSIASSYFAYIVYEFESANISIMPEDMKLIITGSIASILLAYVSTVLVKRIYNIGSNPVKTSVLWFHVILIVESAYYAIFVIFFGIEQWLLPNDMPPMLLLFSILLCTGWGYGLMTKIWELRGHNR